MSREELKKELIDRIEVQSSFRDLQRESIKIVNELLDGLKYEEVYQ